jgi:hypothetical protein
VSEYFGDNATVYMLTADHGMTDEGKYYKFDDSDSKSSLTAINEMQHDSKVF